MKSKLLVLTLAPAMLIATARLAADDTATGSAGQPQHGKHHQEMLARFDQDGDGKLSEEEKAAAKSAMSERKGEMLTRFDANGDGKLDDAERTTARNAAQAPRGSQLTDEQRARMKAEFEAFAAKHDADGDGKLSPKERKLAREAFAVEHPEAAARMRKAVDKDGDGTASRNEKREAAKELRKKRQPAGEASTASE